MIIEECFFEQVNTNYGRILIAECTKSNQLVAVFFIEEDVPDDFEDKLEELQQTYPTVKFLNGSPYHTRIICNAINSLDSTLEIPKALICANNVAVPVYEYLQTIPKGETRTYAEIAEHIGRPNDVGLVIESCQKNNLAFIVPCHRAVLRPGTVSGYRWGVEKKLQLLQAEGVDIGWAAM